MTALNVRKDLTSTTLLFSLVDVIICFVFGLVFFPLVGQRHAIFYASEKSGWVQFNNCHYSKKSG